MERSIWRILDANFNRAREAARTMEEYCRFALNDKTLSGRCKQIRHGLCEAVGRLDGDLLVGSRDSAGDVGRGMQIERPMGRESLADVFTAAVRRITEALRAMAECGQVVEPGFAAAMEGLRFDAYELERDVHFAAVRRRFDNVRLYVLLTVTPEIPDDRVLKWMDDCVAGGADCVQLRPKNLADGRIFALSEQMVQRCESAGLVSIVNDRADIALTTGATGVHLGQGDVPVEAVRKLACRPLLLGYSTHNPEELTRGIEQRFDYVGIGPAFDTATKPWEQTAGPDYLRHAVQTLEGTGVGHVAIGGITGDNVRSVLDTGVRAVAVCAAVTGADDPRRACRELRDIVAGTGL